MKVSRLMVVCGPGQVQRRYSLVVVNRLSLKSQHILGLDSDLVENAVRH